MLINRPDESQILDVAGKAEYLLSNLCIVSICTQNTTNTDAKPQRLGLMKRPVNLFSYTIKSIHSLW